MAAIADHHPRSFVPVWIPVAVLNYLRHTEGGTSLRRLSRMTGLHASTVLRQVRKLEARRDDLLVDLALDRLGAHHFSRAAARHDGTRTQMNAIFRDTPPTPSDDEIDREATRILRRLCEPGACLAVAKEMEKAVVVREQPGGESVRTAALDRQVAEAMALKDWISCAAPGRISRYTITSAGRAALKRLVSDGARADAFGAQHRDLVERDAEDEAGGRGRRARYNMAESPLTALARRRDKDGQPFLSHRMVAAGERLREDFELAQMGPRVAQNWDRFLTVGDRGAFAGDGGLARGPKAARERVLAALGDLGPGLGDIVLRCCCFLEGLEATERRMGWSARSGKIVLRIALQRLCRHYDGREAGWSPLIG